MAIKIVTDSTADLPPELVSELDIAVVPLKVHFGDVEYLDGIDLDPDSFSLNCRRATLSLALRSLHCRF